MNQKTDSDTARWKAGLGEYPEDPGKIHWVRLISEETCQELLAQDIPEDAWTAGQVAQSGYAPSRRCELVFEPTRPELFVRVKSEIAQALAHLLVRNGEEVFKLSYLQIVRYNVGQHFGMHRDGAPNEGYWRRYSYVCYLNDDYEGGATHFPNCELSFKPKIGYAAMFPAYYVHEGQVVSKGTKYIINAFLNDPHCTEVL